MFLAVGLGFLVSIGRKKTTRGYFLGGKTLPWFVVACSMLASDISSEHFIANAGSGYTYGIVSATQSWNCWITYTIFIWIFLPYYVRTNLYTIPEFLERRYSSVCRYIFSASLVVGYVGAILAGTALLMSQVDIQWAVVTMGGTLTVACLSVYLLMKVDMMS